MRQGAVVALDDLELVRWIGADPDVALLDADAAVALGGGDRVGQLDLEDVGAAVAVAAVLLERGSGGVRP